MSHTLKRIKFEPRLLSLVNNFNCGDTDWAIEMNEWISNNSPDCVIDDSEKGVDVWLYVNDLKEVVGFGALAADDWPVNGPDSPSQTITIIFAWAIQVQFQGQPAGDENRNVRYSKQIFENLLKTASSMPGRYPAIGLFVHPDNPATGFYRKYGFVPLENHFEYNSYLGINYISMIRSIERIEDYPIQAI